MENLKKQDFGVYAYDTNTIQYMQATSDTGIYITKVVEDTAAEKAGLQVGDIILSIDDNTLERMCELRRYIYTKNVGDEVTLVILRNNRKIEITATLEERN